MSENYHPDYTRVGRARTQNLIPGKTVGCLFNFHTKTVSSSLELINSSNGGKKIPFNCLHCPRTLTVCLFPRRRSLRKVAPCFDLSYLKNIIVIIIIIILSSSRSSSRSSSSSRSNNSGNSSSSSSSSSVRLCVRARARVFICLCVYVCVHVCVCVR